MTVIICVLKQTKSMGYAYPKCDKRVNPDENQPYALCRSNLSTCAYLRSFNVEDPKEPEVDTKKEIPLDSVVSMETL